MKIECHDHTVRELLESSYYEIPRFQRPYSWDKENLDDFWTDVYESEQKDYFIGSIVTYKSGDSRAVVDGQQRLTTLTVLLSALRNNFEEIGSTKQASGIHRLIERFDIDDANRFVLSTETSYPFLQFAIQSRNPDLTRVVRGEEDELLFQANLFLTEKIANEVMLAKSNGVQNVINIKVRAHKRLEQLRDTALALKLILVQLDNEDDAYLVFETLNTRGKDLTSSDLLKNHLARMLRENNAKGDSVKVKWTTVSENIKTIQLDDVSIDEFIYHFWLAKNDFTKARDIFYVAKKSILTKAAAKKALDELEKYSGLYRDLYRSNLRKWRNDETKIRMAIEVIVNRFRVRQPLPLMLTALYKYEDKALAKVEIERLFSAIELFTFTNTGLMSARSSGGVLQMYSHHARALHSSNAPTRREVTIDNLLAKLHARLPSKEIFIQRFSTLRYSDQHLGDKRLIQYALIKLFQHLAPSISVDPSQMSIEHIEPQSSKAIDTAVTSTIGNLWYLNTQFNNSLGNMEVAQKLVKYRVASLPCDEQLKNAVIWNAESIQSRTVHLAEAMWAIVQEAHS